MNIPKTILDIKGLIKNKVEENLHLDYKAAGSLQNTDGKKTEIAKDVCAMANSDGGIIIYGMAEFSEPDKKYLPEKISPINRTEFSKEWLENVINSNISPRIDGLVIIPIPLENEQKVVYVVDIPKSTTAHQNTKDYKYYKRYNFSAVPMLAYEIQDVMNRNKHPEIELDFIIEKFTSIKVKDEYVSDLANYTTQIPEKILETRTINETSFILKCTPVNEGKVFANYINYYLGVNPYEAILKPELYKFDETNDHLQIFGDNTFRDVIDYIPLPMGEGYSKYGPSRYDPVLPNTRGYSKNIKLNPDYNYMNAELEWTVYADNAMPKTGKLKLNDVEIEEKHGVYEE